MIAPAFLAEIAKAGPVLDVWIEIEGLPYAYGLTERGSAWFAPRSYELRRRGVLGLLTGPLDGVEQEVRPFDADSSIGQMTARIMDDGAGVVREMYASSGRRDGWARLNEALDEPALPSGPGTQVVIAVTHLANLGALAAGDLLYCGRETWEVVSSDAASVTVVRGMFRPAAPLERFAYAHSIGDVISRYPRFIATRRAFVYAAPFRGTDDDKLLRWAGTLRGARLTAQGLLELTIESAEADLRARCFTGQIRGRLAAGIAAPDGSYDGEEGEPFFADRIRLDPASVSGRSWEPGQQILVQVGGEVFSVRTAAGHELLFAGGAAYPRDGRGVFGTRSESHAIGDEASEVIGVVPYHANGSTEERVSRFARGDNPLDIVLQVLLSREGDGTNGPYDVLPRGWGLGLDASRVDVAGIEALRDRWLPHAKERRLITEPFTAKTFISSVLKTHLCYPVTLLGDRLTFRFLGPPMPDEPLVAVTGMHVSNVPDWASGIESVVGRLIVRCDVDPFSGEPRQTFTGEFQGPGVEAQEFYAGYFQTLEVEAPGQWSGTAPGAPGFGAQLTTDAETTAMRQVDLVRDRLAKPFPSFEIVCSYDCLALEIGDLVAVTLQGVPDVTTGAPDLDDAICEVRRKTIDDRRGTVTLSLVQTAYAEQHRLIAPAARMAAQSVSGAAGVRFLDVAAHDFTAPAGPTDATVFPAGARIVVYSPDLSTVKTSGYVVWENEHEGSTTYRDPTSSYLWAWLAGGTISANDIVLLDAWATQPDAVKARFAFLAHEVVAHRHWRYRVTAGHSSYVGIRETEMREAPGGPDVTAGATASADSTFTTYTPDKAIDDTSAHWLSGPGATHWWAVDFGTPRRIVEFTWQLHGAATESPSAFALQWSDDGVNWTDAASWSGLTWTASETKAFQVETGPDPAHEFTP